VVFCIVFFSFKTNFFFAKIRDGFEGVQRRGPVKGAVCPRSSKTLDREHRWNNAGRERRGLSGEKTNERRTSAKNTEWRRMFPNATKVAASLNRVAKGDGETTKVASV
jgi:hypothetical protein